MILHHSSQARNPDRVVLLGGSGFIGAAIRTRLEAMDLPVVSLGSTDMDLVEPAAVDALSVLLKPSDTILMLAALTPDKGRDIATLMKNLAMMRSVCEAIGQSRCAHFVYFSSDAVYDPAESRVSENTPASPRDLYGTMHYTREIMTRTLVNVPTLILRPTLVYGRGDTHNSYGPNRFRRTALKDGKISLFGNGEETRDHVHVDDVAMLIVRCLLHRSTGLLNVASGTSRSFREVAELVGRPFGRHIEIICSPRQNAISHRHYDVTHLIKAFPDFRYAALEDGLARVHLEETGMI